MKDRQAGTKRCEKHAIVYWKYEEMENQCTSNHVTVQRVRLRQSDWMTFLHRPLALCCKSCKYKLKTSTNTKIFNHYRSSVKLNLTVLSLYKVEYGAQIDITSQCQGQAQIDLLF
jgi:hypothetical protein